MLTLSSIFFSKSEPKYAYLDRIHTFLVLAKLHLVSWLIIHWVDSEFSWKSQHDVLLPGVWQLRVLPLPVAIFVQRPQGHLQKVKNVKFDICCPGKSINKGVFKLPDKGKKAQHGIHNELIIILLACDALRAFIVIDLMQVGQDIFI